jgi:hypothetical protein
MHARRLIAVVVAVAAVGAGPAPVGEPIPLAVRGGRVECVLPTLHPNDQYILILGSLARAGGPFRVAVRAEPTADPVDIPQEPPPADDGWVERTRAAADRLARARRRLADDPDFSPNADPPRRRSFSVFVGDHDFTDPGSYVTAQAELRATGERCLVYADTAAPDSPRLRAAVADVVRTFDREVEPYARRCLGRPLDVDRDGRFAILLTPRLGQLSGGKVSLGGCVRGCDFYRDLAAPFGNACDLLYLNAGLAAGPPLRSILAHEYTHAVVFCEHVFGDYPPAPGRRGEEGWLDEAVCHLVEDHHAYGWDNLDYRVRAFLHAPERHALVVPDYYATNLWRSPGHRGAAYLFLRWCADRPAEDGGGPELAGRLTRSNLAGVANLEAATQTRFADLFRGWSVALALSGTGVGDGRFAPLRRFDLHGPLGDGRLDGPRFRDVPMTIDSHSIELAPTAVAFLRLHTPAGERTRLTVTADPACELQATLVRLPADAARLEVRAEAKSGMVRLTLTAHGGSVTLDAVTCEPEAPGPGAAPVVAVREWFPGTYLNADETRTGAAVPLPAEPGPFVVRVAATDAGGRRLTAWATVGR